MTDIQYWNYRVMRDGQSPDHPNLADFTIIEVYYDATDRYVGWVAPKPSGDSENDLRADLEMMMEAFDKPVIDKADLPGDEEEPRITTNVDGHDI
jgi:hypothetical protein